MGRALSVPISAGYRSGNLLVVQKLRTAKGQIPKWRCQCDCGVRISVPQNHLTRKEYPKSHCGCKAKEGVNPYKREKSIWHMMHRRCYFPTHESYAYYGGKGVTICPRWHKDNPDGFNNFIQDIGPAPSKKHSIDRIDPRKNYEPGNVRWATAKEQGNNQRRHWEGKD